MRWTRISVYTSQQGVEPLTGVLLRLGAEGFEIVDKSVYDELLAGAGSHWDYIDESVLESVPSGESVVRFYLAQNEQGSGVLYAVKEELARLKAADADKFYGSLKISCDTVDEEDWANNWKQYFKPFPVGERLLVRPSWEPADDDGGRAVLSIDPGSSFGTGQHHTTRLCLEELERELKDGDRLLDLGCGSGILMIAGLLLGAQSAAGVDIDENSVRVAGENAAQNDSASSRYRLFCGDITADGHLAETIGGGYDIITANIVADVIIAMAESFGLFIKPSGTLIVSGIITERADEVTGVLTRRGFTLRRISQSGGWAAAVLGAPTGE